MAKVLFRPTETEAEVPEGTNLLAAATDAHVPINATCGGAGLCGTCQLQVLSGTVQEEPSTHHLRHPKGEGAVLACRSKAKGNAEVLVLDEGLLSMLGVKKRELSELFFTNARDMVGEDQFAPPTRKLCLQLPPPSLDDPTGDVDRVLRELKNRHGMSNVVVDFDILPAFSDTVRAKDWEVTVTILKKTAHERLIGIEPGDTTACCQYGIAADVGTTTIVVQLINLATGEILEEASDYNDQIQCGEDVISRIVFAGRGGGLRRLHKLVIETVQRLVAQVLEEAEVDAAHVTAVVAAGNTTMTHLLLGLPPKHIREAPYVPTVRFPPWLRATHLGLELLPNAYLYCAGSLASYVGGDITAGVLSSDLPAGEELTLYIDVGTNGEIVLGNAEWMVACSCSAGPAFEGGGIKHGMRATPGAIDAVEIDPISKEPVIATVAGAKPKGICGSGLIELAAEMFSAGIVEPNGKIDRSVSSKRIRKGGHGHEYVLVWAADAATGTDIVITEVDIDNLMRAKAAVFAAINVLTESVGISTSDIVRVEIAGGFGAKLNIGKAVTIGLLPDLGRSTFSYVGNGSLHGASMILCSRAKLEQSVELVRKMSYIDLSSNPDFMNRYVSALFLPHTDMSLFPSVKAEQERAAKQAAGGER